MLRSTRQPRGLFEGVTKGNLLWRVGGKNALHWAAEFAQDDIIKFFMTKGADVSAPMVCKQGKPTGTALHLAAANGHESTVRILLQAGVPLVSGPTDALSWAAQNGQYHMVQFLMDKGATASHDALKGAAKAGHIALTQMLIDTGSPVNLLDAPASMFSAPFAPKSALDLALENGHETIAKLLLATSSRTDFHLRSLSVAAGKGHEACVRMLLELGAPGLPIKYSPYPSFWGYRNSPQAMEMGLFQALHAAAGRKYVSIVSLLLQHEHDPNKSTSGDYKPLHFAALNYTLPKEGPRHSEAVAIAELLINAGASVDARTFIGETPLHFAVHSRNYQLCDYLTFQGANLEGNQSFTTPLQDAARLGYSEIVDLLLDSGCDIDARSRHNNTALHFAAMDHQEETYLLLLRRGADTSIRSEYNSTAFEIFSKPIVDECASGRFDAIRLKNTLSIEPPHRALLYPFTEIITPDYFLALDE
ncbi:hypothetical protein AJ80_05227 [Polytolypa hystricis UAMH7299]|uniref:Uncharacterized protein n=1 Tax=Polytolypa hystricis (strain UAMH7299) TaxID=1447883 RepID=A0A2B7Y6Z3_POLH7|nr:hypothetical protein AJ80_05227 [Polytolypa hystricis UAMH7299]